MTAHPTYSGCGLQPDRHASDQLDYYWRFVGQLPFGSNAVLLDFDTATPSFFADVTGSYVVQLVVTDEAGLSSPDPADEDGTVVIGTDNLVPIAVAGNDQLVIIGDTVLLDGSMSTDPEDDLLTYEWTMSPPMDSLASLSGAETAFPFFVPDLEGLYELSLEVSDFIGPGPTDVVAITATTAEGYGEIQIVAAGEVVADLATDQVTNQGNQQAFLNFLSQAVLAIQGGELETAVDKLEKSLARADGCTQNEPSAADGNGPGRDWITGCTAQIVVYNLLLDALEALEQ